MSVTSGTYVFNPTFDELLEDAAGMVGGAPLLAQEVLSAKRGADLVLTEIQNRGILLYKIARATVSVSASASLAFDTNVIDMLTLNVVTEDGTEIPLNRLDFIQWQQIPNKAQTGRPIQYWFDRDHPTPTLYVWPFPDGAYDFKYAAHIKAEDTVDLAENVDLPRRFLPAFIYALAYWIGLKRPAKVPLDRLQMIRAAYENELERAFEEDRERVSVIIRLER